MKCDRLGHTIRMALIAVASIYASDAGAQSRGCASRFSFCAGCDTFTTISVQTGKVCTIRYSTGFTGGAIFGQKVVVRPRGGIYGTANETFGAYKPNDGFVGSDSFQVDIEFERFGQRFVTHLKANVNVHP
jgi:hypothetical protein